MYVTGKFQQKIIKQNYKFSALARKVTLLYSNSSTDGTKIKISLKIRISTKESKFRELIGFEVSAHPEKLLKYKISLISDAYIFFKIVP